MENQVKKTLIFLVILSSLLLAGCEQPLVPEPESIVISFEKNDIDATGTMVDQIVDSGVLVSINDNTFIKSGWEFAGWATSSSGDAVFDESSNYIILTESTVLYAKWARSLSLTYKGNGHTDGTVPILDHGYYAGSTVTVLGNSGHLIKEGFSFSGWNRLSDGSGTNYSHGEAFLMGETDISLYARWIVNHAVTFEKNNAGASGVMANQNIAQGSSVQLSPNEFTYPGWTFAGWAMTPDGVITYADEWYYTMGSSNLTLFAIWTQSPSHQLAFNPNGGSGTMSNQAFREGLPALLASNEFTREGYSFDGWSDSPSGSVLYADNGEFTIGSADMTLYALWNPNTYSISFDKNDPEVSGSMENQQMEFDSSSALSVNVFTKAGWSFAGWSTTPSGSVQYVDGGEYTMGSDNVVLYAQWTANLYVITFEKNDADAIGSMSIQSIACDSSSALNSCEFSKTGWSFLGWADTPGGPVVYSDSADYLMGAADISLYAKWSVNSYPISFNVGFDGPDGLMDNQLVEFGSTVTLNLNSFYWIGSSFTGWNTSFDGSGTEYTDGDSFTMDQEGVTLFAQWTINQYTITYADLDGTGGTVPDPITLDYGYFTTAENPGNLVNIENGISLILSGWAVFNDGIDTGIVLELGETYPMTASDVTLYAQWTVISAIGPAGGWIIYDKGSYSDGWRYLEAAPYDQSSGIRWNNGANTETGAIAMELGTGGSNTGFIIASQGAGDYAAQLCNDLSIIYNEVSYDDWFLPSADELSAMFLLKNRNIGDLSDFPYWSSTDEEIPGEGYISAISIDFSNGSLGGNPKEDPLFVRAIRSF